MNNAPNTPPNLIQAWQFGVEIQGFTAAYFTRSNLPEIEFEESSFAPAGSLFNTKLPGRATFSDVVMSLGQRAEEAEDAAWLWVTKQADFQTQVGADPSSFMLDVAITQYSRPGNAFRRWVLFGAWVKKYVPGDMDGSSSDPIVRELTLTYQFAEPQ